MSTCLVGEPYRFIQALLYVGSAGRSEAKYRVPHIPVVRVAMYNGVLMEDFLAEVDDGDAVMVSEAEADALCRLSCDVHPVAVGHGA